MRDWLNDGRRLLALAIIFGVIVGAWMFRYETLPPGAMHRNRLTGNVCHISQSCWFCNGFDECKN
jgi:hypothetical protein